MASLASSCCHLKITHWPFQKMQRWSVQHVKEEAGRRLTFEIRSPVGPPNKNAKIPMVSVLTISLKISDGTRVACISSTEAWDLTSRCAGPYDAALKWVWTALAGGIVLLPFKQIFWSFHFFWTVESSSDE